MLYGRLDKESRLIGIVSSDEPVIGAIPLPDGCDLPTDGSYKWVEDAQAFFPLGHGFPRATTKPPYSEMHVLYMMAKAMRDTAPAEVAEWAAWYESHMKQQSEERTMISALRNRGMRRGR